MAQITVNVPDKKLRFFIELVESLGFTRSTRPDVESTLNEDLAHVAQGLDEVKRIQSGELQKNKIEDLLRGL